MTGLLHLDEDYIPHYTDPFPEDGKSISHQVWYDEPSAEIFKAAKMTYEVPCHIQLKEAEKKLGKVDPFKLSNDILEKAYPKVLGFVE